MEQGGEDDNEQPAWEEKKRRDTGGDAEYRANLTKQNFIWHLIAKPQTYGRASFSSHLGANSILEADARHDIGNRVLLKTSLSAL